MGRGQSGSEGLSLLYGAPTARHHQGGPPELGPPFLTVDAANWFGNIIEDIEMLGEYWGLGADFEHEGADFVEKIDRALRDLQEKFESGGRAPLPLSPIDKRVLLDAATALQAMEDDGKDRVVGDRKKTWRGWAAKDLKAAVEPDPE